jgi:hypothetical protein
VQVAQYILQTFLKIIIFTCSYCKKGVSEIKRHRKDKISNEDEKNFAFFSFPDLAPMQPESYFT